MAQWRGPKQPGCNPSVAARGPSTGSALWETQHRACFFHLLSGHGYATDGSTHNAYRYYEDDFQGWFCLVCYLGCEVDGIGWVARRGSRGWRGVIYRPGREDFKVSETSQECDRGAENGRDRGTEGEYAGESRNKIITLNLCLLPLRSVGQWMSFNGQKRGDISTRTAHGARRNLANAVSESVRLFGRHLSGFPLAARLDGCRLVPPGEGRVMKLAR